MHLHRRIHKVSAKSHVSVKQCTQGFGTLQNSAFVCYCLNLLPYAKYTDTTKDKTV